MKTMYEVGLREKSPKYIRELSVVKETGCFIFCESPFGRVRRQKKETSWTTTFETKEEAIAYVTANAERANQKHKECILRDAAPELLEALESMLDALDKNGSCMYESLRDDARAAIAKAKGE